MVESNAQMRKMKPKPSDRLIVKTANPFGTSNKKHKSNFGHAYAAGSIPCRIDHGCNKNQLKWDQDPSTIDYDPLLVNCFEGLCETDHPYSFMANQALTEMLMSEGASQKTVVILDKLILPLRTAMLNKNPLVWSNACDALGLLSEVTGQYLTQHIHILMG